MKRIGASCHGSPNFRHVYVQYILSADMSCGVTVGQVPTINLDLYMCEKKKTTYTQLLSF